MINIVAAYPDFLDLYGEYSAVRLLQKRLWLLMHSRRPQHIT